MIKERLTFEEEFGEAVGKTIEKKYALFIDGKQIEFGYYDIVDRIIDRVKKYSNIISNEDISKLREALYDKRIVLGGSITEGFGTSKLISLSNCYVIPPPKDNYQSIIDTDNIIAQIEKRRGGVGVDLSNIRKKGDKVNNAALTSTGVVPFMKRYSNTTLEVSQDGRRGALMLSIDYKHKDALDFVNAKANTNEVTGANISVRIDEGIFVNEYKELLDTIAHNMWKFAEPGVLFWDNIIDNPIDSMNIAKFKTSSTNPCGEIPLSPYSSCLLAHLVLYKYVINPFTKESRVDLEKLKDDARVLTIFMNIVVEEEIQGLSKIINVAEEGLERNLWLSIRKILQEGRRLGIGKTGLADMFAALLLPYANNKIAEVVSAVIAREVIKTSLDLNIEAPILRIVRNRVKFMNHPFIKRIINSLPDSYKDRIPANIGFLTIAPVGTGSMIAEVSSGMEPVFAIMYKRKRRANGSDKEDSIVIDSNGDKWIEFNVFHKPYLDWYNINKLEGNPIDYIKDSPYYLNTTDDIDIFSKIDLQSTLQKFTDHSISVTHNVDSTFPLDNLVELIKYAHSKKLKGFTLYRKGSRDAILKNLEDIEIKSTNERPTILSANIHTVKIEGKDWIVLIGLLNEKPYEIFALKVKNIVIRDITNSKLERIKVNDEYQYNLISDQININDLTSYYTSGNEEVFTRLLSRLLKMNIDIESIINDFDSVNPIIGTFENVIKKVLYNYITTENMKQKCPECGSNLTIEGGCSKCYSCGYEKC